MAGNTVHAFHVGRLGIQFGRLVTGSVRRMTLQTYGKLSECLVFHAFLAGITHYFLVESCVDRVFEGGAAGVHGTFPLFVGFLVAFLARFR